MCRSFVDAENEPKMHVFRRECFQIRSVLCILCIYHMYSELEIVSFQSVSIFEREEHGCFNQTRERSAMARDAGESRKGEGAGRETLKGVKGSNERAGRFLFFFFFFGLNCSVHSFQMVSQSHSSEKRFYFHNNVFFHTSDRGKEICGYLNVLIFQIGRSTTWFKEFRGRAHTQGLSFRSLMSHNVAEVLGQVRSRVAY